MPLYYNSQPQTNSNLREAGMAFQNAREQKVTIDIETHNTVITIC